MKWLIWASPVILVFVVECVFSSEPTVGSDSPSPKAVTAAAQAALGPWIESIPTDQLERYGFGSAEEAARASLLEPLPSYSPSRFADDFSRSWIESQLDEPALSWLVPVAVDRKIVCMIVVDTPVGGQPQAVEFGKSFAANRLSAGLRLLGGADHVAWRELRFLSYLGPNVDLLLLREASGTWRWLNLEGTFEGSATEIGELGISELIEMLRLPPEDQAP